MTGHKMLSEKILCCSSPACSGVTSALAGDRPAASSRKTGGGGKKVKFRNEIPEILQAWKLQHAPSWLKVRKTGMCVERHEITKKRWKMF